jgi:hypothetical protein
MRMQIKVHAVIYLLVLAMVPSVRAVPIVVSAGAASLRFDAAKLGQDAKAYYEKQGAIFSYDSYIKIVIALDQEDDSGGVVAIEFKQPNEHSIWIWFNKAGQVVQRSSSVIIEGTIIPGSPVFSY